MLKKRGAAEFFWPASKCLDILTINFSQQFELTCQVIRLASQFDTEDDRVDLNKQLESICLVILTTNIQLAELFFWPHADETSVTNLSFNGKFINSKALVKEMSVNVLKTLHRHLESKTGGVVRTLALDKCHHRYSIQNTATCFTHRLKIVGAWIKGRLYFQFMYFSEIMFFKNIDLFSPMRFFPCSWLMWVSFSTKLIPNTFKSSAKAN